jgi:hypothetical protein
MAKRFNVSIPDALAERMEPFKNDLSLSALMQDAIERELTRLTMSDGDKELRDQFKAAAISAWIERFPGMGEAMTAYADHLFELAAKDGQTEIFSLYRLLFFSVKREEGIKEALQHAYPHAPDNLMDEFKKAKYFLEDVDDYIYSQFLIDIESFVESRLKFDADSFNLHDFLAYNEQVRSLLFNALDARVRGAMTESDLYQYVLDLDITNPIVAELC